MNKAFLNNRVIIGPMCQYSAENGNPSEWHYFHLKKLMQAGSGLLTTGNPTSDGIPQSFASETIVLPYNDEIAVTNCFKEHKNSIAGVIIEPFAGNMNLVKPNISFLKVLREECDTAGSILIFDEVMTGFRVDLHGAQGLLKVKPDITTLGKVIGGGLPMGAFGGKKEIMEHISPLGNVYHAGTLSGNPIAVAAGIATLKIISKDGFFSEISEKTSYFVNSLENIAKKYGYIKFCSDSVGGMFGIYFRETIPKNFKEINECNTNDFNKFFHFMLEGGVYFAPSPFEAGFLSIQHDEKSLEKVIKCAKNSFRLLNENKLP